MTVYLCIDPATGISVSVDDAAPGYYSGQTLTCRVGYDEYGDPTNGLVVFPAIPHPEIPEPPTGLSGATVAEFLGMPENAELVALCGQHLQIITALARSYTRGGGFDADTANADMAAVLVTATARLVANPEQIATQVGTTAIRGGFAGWSLAETFVLNAYRGRAL